MCCLNDVDELRQERLFGESDYRLPLVLLCCFENCSDHTVDIAVSRNEEAVLTM
jgi:hypothetical protein